jgi:hypothetical protein
MPRKDERRFLETSDLRDGPSFVLDPAARKTAARQIVTIFHIQCVIWITSGEAMPNHTSE